MKKTLLIIPVAILFVILLASFGGGDPNLDYPSGAPAGYTGSPADGQDCSDCHGGTATNATGIITSNVPGSGYVPGTAYTITVTLTGSVGKGFEVSPQNASGTLLGTLTAGSNNHITGTKYVTHNSKITTSPAVWNFTWTAPAAGTGQVTFYGAFTLSKPVTKLSTLVVNEGTPAPVTANATATPASIIQGATSQLNVTATGGTGSYSYSWTSNPAGFTSNLQNPVVTPSVTTIYTAHVTSGSQSVNANTTVTVTPLLTAAATATPSSVVAGSTSQLNVNPTGGTGTYTYSWTSNPAGFTSTLRNPVVTPLVNTVYTAHVTSGSQSVNSTATVTVIPLLTATASATPASITAGSTSQLNASPTGGTGSYTYSWTSNPAGFTSNLQNPVVTPSVTTIYTAHVTSGSQSVNSPVTVTVISALSATASATPASVIAGSTSQLNVVPSGGSGSYTYSWTSSPAGFTSNLQNPVVTPSVTTIYTAHVTSGSQSVNSTATVTVIPLLTATASATPASIIEGSTSQLNVNPTGGTGTYTYSWTSNPAGFTSNLQNPVVTPSVTTIYTAHVTSGSQSVNSPVTVTVISALSATASATPASVIAGSTSQLNVVPSGGTGSYTYSWTSSPAGFTSNLQNPVVIPSVTTIYTAHVTSGSQSVNSTATVTVIPLLTATASATPASVIAGSTSQLNVVPSGGSGSYTYSWTSSPAGFTSNLQNPVVTPSVTTIYTAHVTSGSQSVNSPVTVTVISALSATASATPASVIAGSTSQLNVVPSGGSGSYTYSWTSSPAGFTSNLQNPVVTPSVTTIYTAHITSGSQSVNSPVTVIVISTLAASASATPASVIAGSTSQLNVVPSGGSGSYTYSWTSNPVGFTSNLQNPIVTPSVTTIYTAQVTSGSQSVNSTATVTVIPLLTATASATPASIIEGSTSQLNATPAGGTGSYTYSWTSNPAGFTSNLQNPVVTPAVNTVYNVQVTSGTRYINSDVSVTVVPLLTASATATPASIVPGGSSQLDAIAAGGSGTYSYSWVSDPPGFTSSVANPIVSPGSTTNYTVTISSGSQSTTANTIVTVSSNLVANATANPSEIIVGEISQLDVTTSGGTTTETYLWSSDPSGFTSTLQNPQVSPSFTTVYSVVVTNGSQTASASTTVTVFDVLSVTASALPSTIDIGETSQLSSIPSGGDGTYTYLWTSDPAGFTSVEQNPQVLPDETTTFTVQVTSGTQTTTSTTTVTVNGPTGIGNTENAQISISPNPTSGAFKINLTSKGEDNYRITIYDLHGKTIMNDVLVRDGNNSFNLTGQSAGIYLISIKSDHFSKIVKLILQ